LTLNERSNPERKTTIFQKTISLTYANTLGKSKCKLDSATIHLLTKLSGSIVFQVHIPPHASNTQLYILLFLFLSVSTEG
jgi:hypothetical protein